jgi:hypothetical protein
MSNRKLHQRLAGVLALTLLAAHVSAEAPKITGFIDTTYSYDFNKPMSRLTSLRSFDRKQDTFLLNAAQVNVEGSKDGIGYYAELGFGTDASIYKSAGTGADGGLPAAPSTVAYNVEVQEAFLTYKCPMTNIMFKAGKFVTFQGIEVIEAKDNYNISRGFLFSLAEPYTHVGALVGYALPKYVDFWIGATNGWDLHTDNNTGKTLLAKVGLNLSDRFWGNVSMTHGAEQANNTNNARTSVDTTWFLKFIPMTTLALQVNAGQEDRVSIHPDRLNALGHWYGFGLQPKIDITSKFGIGARYEWFSDLDGARTGQTQVVQNISLTPTFNLTDSLMARIEYRHDWSTRGTAFESEMGAFNRSDTNTMSAEFIYKF